MNERKPDFRVRGSLQRRIKELLWNQQGLAGSLYDFLRWANSPADLPGVCADLLGWSDLGGRIDRPVFIWGAPRSGTTLLYELVSQHPQAACLTNTSGSMLVECTGLWTDAFDHYNGEMDTGLSRPARVRRVYRNHVRVLERTNKPRFVGKTPSMTLWIPLVNSVFPQALHIHIIRDGRAVLNSVLNVLRKPSPDFARRLKRSGGLFGPFPYAIGDPLFLPEAERHARQWALMVETGRRDGATLNDRYLELRYENLARHPRETMRQMLTHAQLDFDTTFINTTYPESFENRNYKFKSDDSAFQPGEEESALDIMRPTLQTLGYSA